MLSFCQFAKSPRRSAIITTIITTFVIAKNILNISERIRTIAKMISIVIKFIILLSNFVFFAFDKSLNV